MKKIIVISSVFIGILSLSSCGYNTRDWPRIALPFEKNEVHQITADYNNNGKQEKWATVDDDVITYIYSGISFPHKNTKEDENVTNGCTMKLDINFFVDNQVYEKYDVIFYSFGISKGYVDIDGDGIYFLPGDIESFYDKIVTKMNKGVQ